jgi:hypothetical protein
MDYSAFIYYDSLKICEISYSDNDIDSYEYVFEPIYQALDSLSGTSFRGIQGLDLSLRLKQYVRRNIQPVFIFEHNPLPKKKDFRSLQRIDQCTLLEYLAKNELNYFGDNLRIKPL